MNSFQPHITVATMVEQQGRLLLVREQADGREVLNQPAGHVEAGERLTQAAFRETLEETAWRVTVRAFLGVYIFQPRPGAGVFHRYCFIAEPDSRDPAQRLDDGILEALWLTPAEIEARMEDHRSPLVWQCVHDWQRGRSLPLELIYEHPWPLQQA